MYILGVDCAWTEKEPSGIALVEYQPSIGANLIKLGRSYDEFYSDEIDWNTKVHGNAPDFTSLLQYCTNNGWSVDLITLDIPLASELIRGRRSCDSEISKFYGGKGASVHSPNADRPGEIALSIYEQLNDSGFCWNGKLSDAKVFIEVYPHASIIELLNLDYRLPYKAQKKNKYWPKASLEERNSKIIDNLNLLKEGISTHINGVPEMLPILNADVKYTMRYLKGYEDVLDALICAITGIHYCKGSIRSFGKTEEKIWVVETK